MTRLFTLSLLFLLFQMASFAQNCGPGADNFFSACNICGNGFVGNTAGFTPDNANFSFPCGTIENSQWATFTAASSSVSVSINASNCSNGSGLEMAIYDQNLNLVSNCFSSAGSNMSGTLNPTNLNPGQEYLILIDGFGGDICDFSISLMGNVENLPPLPPGEITNDALPGREVCVGQQVCYSIPPVANATAYEWVVPQNGRIISGQGTTNICAVFDAVGGGVIRVTPSNLCFEGIPAIDISLVLPVVPTILPPIFLCEDELPFVSNGIGFDTFGRHEVVLLNAAGCDSVVNFTLIPIPQIPNVIEANLCLGDCFMIGDSCYTDSTQIVIEGGSLAGCDSIIIFNPTFNLDSVIVNNFRDSIFCIDSCTQLMVDATVLGQNIISNWSTSNGSISASNGLFAEGCGAGDYVLSFTDTLTENSCSVSINLSEEERQIGVLDDVSLISGETCVDTDFVFETSELPNAITYDWSLPNGTIVSTSTNQLVVTSALDGAVCVTATNDCGVSNEVCDTLIIAPFLSAEFMIDSRVCINEVVTLTYLGNASASGGFNFDIPRGDIVSGSGTGPYAIEFNNDGNLTIGLDVEGDGCQSSVFTQRIQVDTIVPPARIFCNRGPDWVEFVWNDIGIVDDFSVNVVTGQAGTQTGRLSYLVSGLGPNEPVTIQVTATDNDNVCGTTSISRETCNSAMLTIDPSNSRKTITNTTSSNFDVEIFPNPATDNFTIKSNSTIEKIEIYDIAGKLVMLNFKSDNIDISKIENGIYLVKITTEEGVSTEKIQKI